MTRFEEWWQPTEEYINTTTEYERQRNTWNAAMLYAAKVATDSSTHIPASNIEDVWLNGCRYIAARLRKEATNG